MYIYIYMCLQLLRVGPALHAPPRPVGRRGGVVHDGPAAAVLPVDLTVVLCI